MPLSLESGPDSGGGRRPGAIRRGGRRSASLSAGGAVLLVLAAAARGAASPAVLVLPAGTEPGPAALAAELAAAGFDPVPAPWSIEPLADDPAAAEDAASLRALLDGALERFYAGEPEAAAAPLLALFTDLQDGRRILEGDPRPLADALHDLAGLLAWIARETDVPRQAADRVLAYWPEGTPSAERFPPSVLEDLAARRAAASPDAPVPLEAAGCTLHAAGRHFEDLLPAAPPWGRLRIRCPGDPPYGVDLGGDAAGPAPLRLPPLAPPEGSHLLPLRIAAALLERGSADRAVTARAEGDRVRWTALDRRGDLRTGAARLEALGREAAEGLADLWTAEGDGGDTVTTAGGWWWLLPSGAGLLLGGGGAWALVDGDRCAGWADRAATLADRDRLLGRSEDLEITGWTLVGTGAAALLAGLIWMAVDGLAGDDGAASGEESP